MKKRTLRNPKLKVVFSKDRQKKDLDYDSILYSLTAAAEFEKNTYTNLDKAIFALIESVISKFPLNNQIERAEIKNFLWLLIDTDEELKFQLAKTLGININD